jgi:hypothetical protein
MKQDDEEHLHVENDMEKQKTASGGKRKGTILISNTYIPELIRLA